VPKIDTVRNPIDAFLLARLRDKGLSFTAEADRRTLIRRATFDLHGLPPTPEEVEAFVNDRTPDAYEKLIERLLASPRYGGPLGPALLDVAGYADSRATSADDPQQQCLEVSRLRHPRLQRRHAVRTASSANSSRRRRDGEPAVQEPRARRRREICRRSCAWPLTAAARPGADPKTLATR
jgi:hypothetical protein